jgi:hypothetical protein
VTAENFKFQSNDDSMGRLAGVLANKQTDVHMPAALAEAAKRIPGLLWTEGIERNLGAAANRLGRPPSNRLDFA